MRIGAVRMNETPQHTQMIATQNSWRGRASSHAVQPKADTGQLVQAAVSGTRAIYRPGFLMAKAVVHLLDLQDGSVEQGELDLDDGIKDRGGLMLAVDTLNQRFGRGTVSMAAAQLGNEAGAQDAGLHNLLKKHAFSYRLISLKIN